MVNTVNIQNHVVVHDAQSMPSLVEIVVPADAQYVYDIDQSLGLYSGSTTYRFICKRNSTVRIQFLLLGGSMVTNRFELILQEEGAQATIMGCHAGVGIADQTVEIVQRHEAPRTTSYSVVHSALTDQASIKYNGMIIISEKATGADAALYNRNLLLSQGARATAIPSLEVHTDQVHCKHGTATSRCDQEQLFYMQSRGIHATQAYHLLLHGFFSQGFNLKHVQLDRIMHQLLKQA